MFWLILGILIIVVGIVFLFTDYKTVAIAIATAGIVVILIGCICKVPTGHTGIVTTFGKVENHTYDAGFHFKAPWNKVVKMNNRVQKNTIELACFSSDIQEVKISYTVNYQIDKANAMTIYRTIGKSYFDVTVVPNITEAVKVVTAKYTAEKLVSARDELGIAIEEELKKRLREFNVELVSASIEDMDFTDAYTNAVEAKQVAQQNKLKAETEAEQKIIEAKAKAETAIIEAQAEAEANRLISESITPELIEMKEAEARLKHGWVEVNGASAVVTDK